MSVDAAGKGPVESQIEAEVGAKVPGLAVMAATAERVVFSHVSGEASISPRTGMNIDTACNWFSMTKLATATVAMQLADTGLLDLDAPVDRYYDVFSSMVPESRACRVTTRHLLSHSAGLANPLPLRWVHLAIEPAPDRRRFVRQLLEKHRRLRSDPGTETAYSNLGYLVVGEVIERVAGVTFERFLETRLLQPLGMKQTAFTALQSEKWATPYQRRGTPLNVLIPLLVPNAIIGMNAGKFRSLHHFYVDGAAYGGLVGPPADAVRFLRAHLGDGELDGTRVLSVEAAKAMRRIEAHGKKLHVGLGWYQRGRKPQQDFVEHLGGGAGFWNCMRVYPHQGIGVVIMGNATSYDHDSIGRAAQAQLSMKTLRGRLAQ